MGFTGLFAKLIAWSPATIISGRTLVASLSVGLVLWLSKHPLTLKSKRDIGWILITGIMLALHWTLYFKAVQLSSVAVGMISIYTYPVFTSLLEPIMHRHAISIKDILAGTLVLVGILLMSPELSLENDIFMGALLGIASAVFFAIRNIMSRGLIKSGYKGQVLMFYQLVITAIFLFPSLLLNPPNPTPIELWYVVLFGTLFTAVAHTFKIMSLFHFKAVTVGILSCLAPVIGAIAAWFLLGEAMSGRIMIGGAVIIGTVIVEVGFLHQSSKSS